MLDDQIMVLSGTWGILVFEGAWTLSEGIKVFGAQNFRHGIGLNVERPGQSVGDVSC